LRAAIKLNPSFAPAYDSLAVLEGRQRRNLDEAHMMALKAVTLEPGNAGYRVNAANVLIQMDRGKDAVAVLREALRVAKNPAETAMVQSFLTQAEQYMNARNRQAEDLKADVQASTVYTSEVNGDPAVAEEELPKGPHRFTAGTLQNVHCHGQGIELTVAAKGKTMALHRGNYHKIEFTSLGFTPQGDLSPCKDLEGRPAKVEYVESGPQPAAAYVVGIELHK
jgi:tetratricopeptide (TPR) repeat protein